jgi:hypothetical protein
MIHDMFSTYYNKEKRERDLSGCTPFRAPFRVLPSCPPFVPVSESESESESGMFPERVQAEIINQIIKEDASELGLGHGHGHEGGLGVGHEERIQPDLFP